MIQELEKQVTEGQKHELGPLVTRDWEDFGELRSIVVEVEDVPIENGVRKIYD